MGKDIQAAFDIVDHLYEYNDEFKLLITKSQKSTTEYLQIDYQKN